MVRHTAHHVVGKSIYHAATIYVQYMHLLNKQNYQLVDNVLSLYTLKKPELPILSSFLIHTTNAFIFLILPHIFTACVRSELYFFPSESPFS